ncbi:ion transporter [Halarcobacter sp.]|uniref:ion transporter n=1 Tax=Halarcobacter sp. TaxID=2321133 RepID=UPI002AA74876|nr:ion transporter [Halarcobacter sp.]
MDFRSNLYLIFEKPTKHRFGVFFQVLIYLNILISITVMFLETEKTLSEYFTLFEKINMVNIFLFTIEYILRLYSRKNKRIKYMFTPFMIIDLVVLLPFYLTIFNIDLGFLRGLRVIRIFKLFRLAKFNEFDKLIIDIFKEKKEEFLYIVIAIFVLLFTLTPLVYYVESKAQPEVFSSMSTTLWWAVTTFTTVGYGDMYPITTMGRILTTFVSALGIAFYAIPGSIFTSSLLDKINEKRKKKQDEQ